MSLLFNTRWNKERHLNRKLEFYNRIKPEFGFENYLHEGIRYKEVSCLASFRMSAHKLRIETGRYHINRHSRVNRTCEECSDVNIAEDLNELPFYRPIIEDELHVLKVCPKYHDIRCQLGESLKTNLFSDIASAFCDTRRIAQFIRKIMNRRFPQEAHPKKKETKRKVKSRRTDEVHQKSEEQEDGRISTFPSKLTFTPMNSH